MCRISSSALPSRQYFARAYERIKLAVIFPSLQRMLMSLVTNSLNNGKSLVRDHVAKSLSSSVYIGCNVTLNQLDGIMPRFGDRWITDLRGSFIRGSQLSMTPFRRALCSGLNRWECLPFAGFCVSLAWSSLITCRGVSLVGFGVPLNVVGSVVLVGLGSSACGSLQLLVRTLWFAYRDSGFLWACSPRASYSSCGCSTGVSVLLPRPSIRAVLLGRDTSSID